MYFGRADGGPIMSADQLSSARLWVMTYAPPQATPTGGKGSGWGRSLNRGSELPGKEGRKECTKVRLEMRYEISLPSTLALFDREPVLGKGVAAAAKSSNTCEWNGAL